MPTVSTAPVVKTRLLELLTAAATGVQVGRHHPGDALEPESIFTGRVRGNSEIPVARAGRKKREEEYTIEVWFVVAHATTQLDAELRAFELLGLLEDLLANDPTLGQDPTTRATLDGWETETSFDAGTGGHQTLLRADVGVACRLS